MTSEVVERLKKTLNEISSLETGFEDIHQIYYQFCGELPAKIDESQAFEVVEKIEKFLDDVEKNYFDRIDEVLNKLIKNIEEIIYLGELSKEIIE